MLLKDISLYLNVNEYERTYGSDFQSQGSRYLCNFVRRRITPLKFQAEEFGSVAVQGCHEPRERAPLRVRR